MSRLLSPISSIFHDTFLLSGTTTTTLLMANHEPRQAKRLKLEGRAFYESIGSPKLILAPMVDQSEFVGAVLSPPIFCKLTDCAGMAHPHSLLHDPQHKGEPPRI